MTIRRFGSLRDGLDFEDMAWIRAEPGLVAWSSAPGIAVPPSHLRAPTFAEAYRISSSAGRPIERRRSGGGAVPQGPGVLNIGWTLRDGQSRGIRGDYDAFAQALIVALEAIGVAASIHSPAGAWCPGDHDVSVDGRKIAGISQRRSGAGATARSFVHAALFVDLPLNSEFDLLERYLDAASMRDWPRADAATTLAAECAGFGLDQQGALSEILAMIRRRLTASAGTHARPFRDIPHAAF